MYLPRAKKQSHAYPTFESYQNWAHIWEFCDIFYHFCTKYGRPLAPRDDGLVGEDTTTNTGSVKKYGQLCGTSRRDLGNVAARTN